MKLLKTVAAKGLNQIKKAYIAPKLEVKHVKTSELKLKEGLTQDVFQSSGVKHRDNRGRHKKFVISKEEFVKLKQECGGDVSKVAQRIGCSRNVAFCMQREFGLAGKPVSEVSKEVFENLIKEGKSRQEIADFFGRTVSHINRILRKYGLSKSFNIASSEELIKKMLSEGKTHAQIADKLGCATSYVSKLVSDLGLTPKKVYIQTLERLVKSGMSDAEIAKELKCSPKTVPLLKKRYKLSSNN